MVEVTAAAPVLQAGSGEVSMNMGAKEVSTLPLDGRNFVPLVAMAPGVALPGGGSVLPRINGSRPRTLMALELCTKDATGRRTKSSGPELVLT